MAAPSKSPIDKRVVLQRARAAIDMEIIEMRRLAKEAADAATHEENKPENDKDMRSTEASYVAGGQAARVRDLERAASTLQVMAVRMFASGDEIALSALVEVEVGDRRQWFLIVGDEGGRNVRLDDGRQVQLVTPQSPLGRALVGSHSGDEIELSTPQGMRTYAIVAIG